MNDRRRFLKLVAGAVATLGQMRPAAAHSAPPFPAQRTAGIRKSVLISMLPKERSYAERFTLAREAGFEAIEMRTVTAEEEAAEIREASSKPACASIRS